MRETHKVKKEDTFGDPKKGCDPPVIEPLPKSILCLTTDQCTSIENSCFQVS
jgi:hypothetical protein